MQYGRPTIESAGDLPDLISPYRSGITITASYAIKQSTRLLKVAPILFMCLMNDE